MSEMDADVLAQREKLLSDLYTEARSMLEGMGKKRKLGAKKSEEGADDEKLDFGKFISTEENPVAASFAEQEKIMADQDAALSSDPVISEVSRMKMPKRGGSSAWKRRIYDTARESIASARSPRSSTGNDVGAVATGLWNQAKRTSS